MIFGMISRGVLGGAAAATAIALGGPWQGAVAQDNTVIELTQTACQFIEAENGVDHDFQSTRKADCDRINAETGAERLAEAEVLRLAPGTYTFRITNLDVPYALGFWLREEGYNWRNPIHKLTKTSVSGGGLHMGQVQDYVVELEPGEYLYSCPLNATPDYRLIVEQ